MASLSSRAGGRAMKQDSEVFVGLDAAKVRHAVAIAEEAGRERSGFSERSTRIQRLFVA